MGRPALSEKAALRELAKTERILSALTETRSDIHGRTRTELENKFGKFSDGDLSDMYKYLGQLRGLDELIDEYTKGKEEMASIIASHWEQDRADKAERGQP